MSSKGGFTLIDRGVLTGRLLVDSRVSAQELIHEKTYTLTHLAQVQLKTKRKDVDITKIPAMFDTTQNVYALVDLNCNDAFLALSLSHKLQVLPLTKQLTCLCGNLWSNSLRSKRADRVEFLLLHEFYGRNFIPPEKLSGMEKKEKAKARKKGGKKGAGGSGGGDDMDDGGAGMDDDDEDDNTGSKKRRKKAQYSGGLVLEPKKGFYDKFVLLLDFNSLYPSIIREFNVCFTTVKVSTSLATLRSVCKCIDRVWCVWIWRFLVALECDVRSNIRITRCQYTRYPTGCRQSTARKASIRQEIGENGTQCGQETGTRYQTESAETGSELDVRLFGFYEFAILL